MPMPRPLACALGALAMLLALPAAGAYAQATVESRIAAIMPGLEARLPPEFVADANALFADGPMAGHESALAHAMLVNRQLAPAAWLFARDAMHRPDSAAAISNAAMLAQETWRKSLGTGAEGMEALPADLWLGATVDLMDTAAAIDPDSAEVSHNLGRARLARYAETGDPADLATAVDALRRASELDPGEALYHARLAEALLASGDADGASEAFRRAHDIDPRNPGVTMIGVANPSLPAGGGSAPARECNVNFECDLNCPKSIIGRLMFVTCMMEEQGAQLACQAGEPYSSGYTCREQVPQFGILIPGLNSGFTLAFPPGIRMDVILNGDGSLTVRFKGGVPLPAGLTPYIDTQGTWDPENGWTEVKFKQGVTLTIAGGASEAAKWGFPPVSVSVEDDVTSGGGRPVIKGELYGDGYLVM